MEQQPFNEELYHSLKNELHEVNAQIAVCSKQLEDLLDQKKDSSLR